MDSRTFNGVRAIEALAMHAQEHRWELERFEAAHDSMLELFKSDQPIALAPDGMLDEDLNVVRAIVAAELSVSIVEARGISEI